MRIRSIKPEFWRSEDIASLDRDTRLLFVGLWSYVDDNGVGRDVEAFIVADLFALDNPSESLAMVSRGLQKLSERGLIIRYTVENKRFLFICKWTDHQKIDHPNKGRYPLPTSENVQFENLSRDTRENLAPGAVEQRNRGTEEQGLIPSSPRAASARSAFDEFWDLYPRKEDKARARPAFDRAVRSAPASEIIAGAARYARDPNREQQFTKHPKTWLNAGSWANGPLPARTPSRPIAVSSTTDERVAAGVDVVNRLREREQGQPRLEIAQ